MTGELKPFTCTYRFEGRAIGITVEARSWDEVSARLRAIGTTAIVNGEQISEFDAFPGMSFTRRSLRKLLRLIRRTAR